MTKNSPAKSREYYSAATACYLAHVEGGQSIRAIAAAWDLHPSTVLRRIRKIELMRDDPLVDQLLADEKAVKSSASRSLKGAKNMTDTATTTDAVCLETVTPQELRALRRLCETGAFLAMSQGLTNAVILRQQKEGEPTRTAVVDAKIAGKMVLNDWLRCTKPGRLACYEVTSAGRAALKRALLAQAPPAGFGESPSVFGEQHKEWGEKVIADPEQKKPRKMRVNLRESPLTTLGRKRGKDGVAFLTPELIAVGERFREDFELAQIGPRVTQNWESFLTPRNSGALSAPKESGFTSAQQRFSAALKALGPGLGDIALRCCCFLEGLETAEKRMGWSARSGKIVLRIALQRLWAHYQEQGDASRRIG